LTNIFIWVIIDIVDEEQRSCDPLINHTDQMITSTFQE